SDPSRRDQGYPANHRRPRRSPRGSQSGLRGTHQNRLTVLAVHDVVIRGGLDRRQRAPVDFELTTAASTGTQHRRTRPPTGPDPIVFGEQFLGNPLRQLRPIGLPPAPRRVEIGERLVTPALCVGQRLLGAVHCGSVTLDIEIHRFLTLHNLEQVVLERLLSAPQRRQLVLDLGELLGRNRARLQHFGVALLTRPYRLDRPFLLGDLRRQIGPGGLCGDERVPVFLQRTLRLLNLVVFGQVRTSVRNPCQFAVHLREIEQRTLRYGLCLHGGLPPVLCVTLASGLSLRTRSSWLITLPDPPEAATFHGSVQV